MRIVPIALLTLSLAALAESPAPDEKVAAAVNAEGVQVVEVTGGSYFFKPRHIVVKARVPLELKLRKEAGMVPHDLVIDAPDAQVHVEESLGEQFKTVRVTFTKPGTYAFYCSKKLLFFKSHKDRGMEGVIEVTE